MNAIATLKIDELTKRSSKFLLCFVLHHFYIQIFILNTLHRITNDEKKTSQQTTKDTKSNYRKVARVQLNLYFIHLLLYYFFFVLPFSVSPQFKTNEIFSAAKIRYCTQWKIHAHNSTCFLVFIVCTLPI